MPNPDVNQPGEREMAGYSPDALARLGAELQHFERQSGGLSAVLPDRADTGEIGPYRIIEMIGEGGMGAVYKAEQQRPVRRIVALKVVKPGLDTREVLSRFEAERQALARMDHPNIAKVFDAGADNLGRPYFVMEYVPGRPITRFCDDQKLSVRDRLLLFIQVCEAISHAHTKGILHRDIKASNVLAHTSDGKHSAKVIDFGVAKALAGDRLTEITFSTDRGVIVGTYDAMSPEQADGSRDIDTRTDVYSLGVLLYEIVGGFKPIDREALTRANDYELRRIIREVEPPRPSARLASKGHETKTAEIAAARQMSPDALVRELRSELEWIPLMALRKERERRYSSPQALSDDIRNYLTGRPLIAGPESKSYVAKKFLARHRASVIGVAAGVILLIAATSFYLHRIRAEQARTLDALKQAQEQMQIAEQQKRRAESESAIATNVKDFVADMLRALNPARARGRTVRLEDVLRESAKRVEQQFKHQPDVEAQLQAELGQTMMAIGHADEALPHYTRALELQQQLSGSDAKTTILAQCRVGESLVSLGRYAEAEAIYGPLLKRCNELLKPDDPVRLSAQERMGHLFSLTGRNEDGEKLLRVVYEQRRQLTGPDLGPDGIDTLRVESTLGLVLSRLGNRKEAETLLRDALERRLKLNDGTDDPNISRLQQNLSAHLSKFSRGSESRELSRASLETARRIYPEGHPDLVSTMTSYGLLLQNERRSAEAEPLAREAYETGLRALGPDHPATLHAALIVQRVLAETGRAAEAVPMARDVLDRRRRLYGIDHAETHDAMRALTSTLMRAKQHDEAMDLMRESVASARRMYGDDHRETLVALAHQAGYLKDARRFTEAEAAYAEVLRIVSLHPSYMTPSEVASYHNAHGLMIKEQGRFSDAKPILEKSLEAMRRAGMPPSAKGIHNCLLALAEIAEAEGELGRAVELRAEVARSQPASRPASASPLSTRPSTRPTTAGVARS